jgi:selenophosphate synthase
VVSGADLTSLSHGAGCGCKLPAAALLPIVRDLPRSTDERLLVAVAPERAGELPGAVVGEIVAGAPGAIAVQ